MEHSTPQIYTEFLPISRADMEARGWEQLDFVVVGGDAYVDHPSFGTAIISRLLEAEGYKVGVLAQPRYTDCEDFKRFGKPKYGFFIGGGNVDSMVSHYSVAKIPRAEDEYSPGGKAGARPDRSATVYTKLAKQAYPDLPVILGGLEASLRRFAHYDYWLDTVLPSIAEDSGADHHQLWHGRAPDRGDRPPSGRRGAGGDHHGRERHLLPDRFRPPAPAVCGVRWF